MRNARFMLLVLLSSLLVLNRCSRRDILDDYPVSGVEISLNWDGVTDKLPEGIRVIFYPKDGEGKSGQVPFGTRWRNESSSGTIFGCSLQL